MTFLVVYFLLWVGSKKLERKRAFPDKMNRSHLSQIFARNEKNFWSIKDLGFLNYAVDETLYLASMGKKKLFFKKI